MTNNYGNQLATYETRPSSLRWIKIGAVADKNKGYHTGE